MKASTSLPQFKSSLPFAYYAEIYLQVVMSILEVIKMIYLIAKGEIVGSVLLIKATDETEARSRLSLKEDEKIIGRLTDNEMSVLSTSHFVVMSA